MSLFAIIKSKLENMYLYRGWSIFNPEGFLIIEFLCNFAIILDIILLLIFIYRRYKYRRIKKMYIPKDEREDIIKEEKEDNNSEDDKIDDSASSSAFSLTSSMRCRRTIRTAVSASSRTMDSTSRPT